MSIYHKNYYQTHKEGMIERQKVYNKVYNKASATKIKIEVLSHYNVEGKPKCSICPEERLPCLSIDHINGNGNKHRRELGRNKSGYYFYKWLKKQGYPKGYRTLCMNCQFFEYLTNKEVK